MAGVEKTWLSRNLPLLRLASCRKVEGERARKGPAGLYCRALRRTWCSPLKIICLLFNRVALRKSSVMMARELDNFSSASFGSGTNKGLFSGNRDYLDDDLEV